MRIKELIELLGKQNAEAEITVLNYQDYIVIDRERNVHLANTRYLSGKKDLLIILEVRE